MAEVAYRSWSLIPRDADPVAGRPTLSNPPMMTSLALDPGASLCFDIEPVAGPLRIAVHVTGLTAEVHSDDFLKVLVGDAAAGAWTEVAVRWDRGQDGLDAVFSATLPQGWEGLKLHLPEGPALVVTKMELAGDAGSG